MDINLLISMCIGVFIKTIVKSVLEWLGKKLKTTQVSSIVMAMLKKYINHNFADVVGDFILLVVTGFLLGSLVISKIPVSHISCVFTTMLTIGLGIWFNEFGKDLSLYLQALKNTGQDNK